MDIDMPLMSGLAVTELLRKDLPQTQVIILSMHGDRDHLRRILKSGARGFVLKDSSTEELLKAIETVNGGTPYFNEEAARLALDEVVRGAGSNTDELSSREREVLVLIAEGLSNKEIAIRLGVGVRTVETHRERIMKKLNIHSIAGLTKYAIAKGLTSLPPEAPG
jgi:two-component system nitrate/nitrite response regulator NarL